MPIREANSSDVNNLEKLKEEIAKYHEKIDPDFYETNRDYRKEVLEMFKENSKGKKIYEGKEDWIYKRIVCSRRV